MAPRSLSLSHLDDVRPDGLSDSESSEDAYAVALAPAFPDRIEPPEIAPLSGSNLWNAGISSRSTVDSGAIVHEAIALPKCAPYLVLGFGIGSTSSSYRRQSLHCRPLVPFNPEVLISYPSQDYVPWSDEPLRVHGYAHTAIISLPPCTTVVGCASGLHCFPAGSMRMIPLSSSRFNAVELPGGFRYTQAKGIIYPRSYPKVGLIMIRRTRSTAPSHPKDFLLSAGFALNLECKIAKAGKDISSYSPGRIQFSIMSQDYAIRFVNGKLAKLFNPYPLKALPLCLINLDQNAVKGIRVHIRSVPYIFAMFCVVLLALPGIVQIYGSQDNDWGRHCECGHWNRISTCRSGLGDIPKDFRFRYYEQESATWFSYGSKRLWCPTFSQKCRKRARRSRL